MRNREKGSEIVEFALVIVPVLALITVLLDVGWSVFAKSSLEWAVRSAVDQGMVMTQTKISQSGTNACLTDVVKTLVQQNSFGLLSGTSGLGYIKVHYFQPPAAGSSNPATDVSTDTGADSPGNIIQVSVQNYSIMPLVPRMVSLNVAPDNNPLIASVYAAGVIQLSSDPPSCLGTAP